MAGLKHVFFGLGFSDLALERGKTLLEGLDLAGLAGDLGVEGRGGLGVGLAAGEGLAGQILAAFLEGQLGLAHPEAILGAGLIGLVLRALLAGDRRSDGLAQLDQVGLHVGHRLIENLGRILRLAHQVVEVGAQQTAEPIKKAHGSGGWGKPRQ